MTRSMVEDGVRALRLAAFSTAATVLALGAHVLAGGAPPALPATVAAVTLPGAAAMVLSRRRRGPVEILVVLGAVQLVLHELFSALPAGGAGHAAMAGHGGGHRVEADSLWMSAAHAGAVLLTALLLARADRVLHLLLSWWRPVPGVAGAPLTPVPVARQRSAVPADVRPVRDLPSHRAAAAVDRRGPPLPVC